MSTFPHRVLRRSHAQSHPPSLLGFPPRPPPSPASLLFTASIRAMPHPAHIPMSRIHSISTFRLPSRCPHLISHQHRSFAQLSRCRSLLLRAMRGLATTPPSSDAATPPAATPSSPSSPPSPPSPPSPSIVPSSSSSPDTIPLTSDGNLDAELGEAMASTGADLSTPTHHLTQSTDPNSTLTALEIDDEGNHSEKDYHPLQLARRFGLHPRDMRFLDSSLRNLPSLLVRREVIIVNLELFKAIISAKEVLMFDPWYPHIQSIVPLMKHALSAFHSRKEGKEGGTTPTTSSYPPAVPTKPSTPPSTSTFVNHLSTAPQPSSSPPSSTSPSAPSPALPSHLPSAALSDPRPPTPTVQELASTFESAFRDRSLFGLRDHEREYEEWMEPRMPFEFIALELILMTVTRTLESRFEVYNSSLSPLLSSSSSALNEGSTLMHLLQLKNGLTSFEVVLEETGMALKQVLGDDRDMLEMFLTIKARGEVPLIDEHEEIEVLLETYLRKVDELENEVRTNVKSISLTEEHIQIRLDTVRNAMMKVDLLVTICTFAVATAALIASTFGMNLTSYLEQSPYAFYITSVVMVVLAAALIKFGLRLCRQHKIDLFHVEPEEPKLRLPVNTMKKQRRRSSPVHRTEKGRKGEGVEEGGLYDREDWYDRGRTLEWKLEKLEEKKRQIHMTEHSMSQGEGGGGGAEKAEGNKGRKHEHVDIGPHGHKRGGRLGGDR